MEFRVCIGLVAMCIALAVASDVRDIITTDPCEPQCEEIQGSICAIHFETSEWFGRFPNARGLTKSQSISEFFHFYDLMQLNNYCSHTIYNLLCFHYFPKCEPERPQLGVTPCRETCNEATAACIEHIRARTPDYTYPEHLNCSNFESGSNCVVGESGGSDCDQPCTACPDATIHLEFATELCKRTLLGSEINGTADICVRLANTGSYDPDDTLTDNVSVNLCPMMAERSDLHNLLDFSTRLQSTIAEEGLDFVAQNSTIIFPCGSQKGDVQCITVEIIPDYIEEGIEVFVEHANIVYPPTAIFGGALNSSSGDIAVIIRDNFPIATPTPPQELTTTTQIPYPTSTSFLPPSPSPSPVVKQIPDSECRRGCNWRTKISGNVFRRNQYTFVAHIRVVGCNASVLEVNIIECRDIVCGTCPLPVPGYHLILCCSDCIQDCPRNEEFIVAGKNSGNCLYIPNYKRGGLFANHTFYPDWSSLVPACS